MEGISPAVVENPFRVVVSSSKKESTQLTGNPAQQDDTEH